MKVICSSRKVLYKRNQRNGIIFGPPRSSGTTRDNNAIRRIHFTLATTQQQQQHQMMGRGAPDVGFPEPDRRKLPFPIPYWGDEGPRR